MESWCAGESLDVYFHALSSLSVFAEVFVAAEQQLMCLILMIMMIF